jgi:hypothetical protein
MQLQLINMGMIYIDISQKMRPNTFIMKPLKNSSFFLGKSFFTRLQKMKRMLSLKQFGQEAQCQGFFNPTLLGLS